MAKNTAFTPNPDFVAQITGSGVASAGYTGPATTGAGFVPVFAATIDLTPFFAVSRFISITNTSSGSGNCTVTATNVPAAGAQANVKFTQYSGGSGALTFSTGFRPTGTVTPNSATAMVVQFVSDGTNWLEVARSVASV